MPEESKKTLREVFEDFITTLDDAIGTLNETKENKRVNQLIFTYIVNSFDSFVSEACLVSIDLVSDLRKDLFKKGKNIDEKASIKDVLEMNEKGIDNWVFDIAKVQLSTLLTQKRHSQKLQLLIENYNIKKEKRYVCLSGGGSEFSSGCLKKKPTAKSKKTLNHQTNSEEVVGYADIVYEKRNAITHNRGKYPQKTIKRLNEEWSLQIKGDSPLVKRGTIRSVIRFYTSFCVLFLESCNYIDFEIEEYLDFLNKLRNFETIKIRGGIQDKYSIRRKDLLQNCKGEKFTVKEYKEKFSVSQATVGRDIKKYKEDSLFDVSQSGKGNSYLILVKND